MTVYQLDISIALAITALGSLALLALNNPTHGNIKLPVYDERHNPYDSDPFDVTKPEDLVDGYPINGDEYWARMKRRKIFLCILLAGLLTVQTTSFVWLSFHGEHSSTKVFVLEASYPLYLFCLGAVSVRQVERHSEFILHLTTLTTLSAALMTFATILPDPETSANGPTSFWFGRVVLGLYIVLTFTTMNTPLGPPLHFPPSIIYSQETARAITNADKENVTGVVGSSPWSTLYFSYVRKVVMLGNTADSLEIGDLPIVPGELRAAGNYSTLRKAVRDRKLSFWSWKPRPGSGAALAYQVFHANFVGFTLEATLSACAALLYYTPPLCLNKLISYLEGDPNREDMAWGWFWVVALFTTNAISSLVRGQLWSLCSTSVKMQIRMQLNALLFAKTLVRKDVASFAASSASNGDEKQKDADKKDFSSKAQIMTLMTADVGRVGDSTWYYAPIEIAIGAYFLYQLLGVSSLIGLAVTCLFSPLNHFATKVVFGKFIHSAQSKLMEARDERIGLMNEVLGGIRMIKFMAWERNFEARVMRVREKELKYQKLTYTITVLWNALWNGSPMIVTLVSFWHFAVVRQQNLTPSIAFTSVLFNELKFALSALPNSIIKILQVILSLQRIEKYLGLGEVMPVPPLERQSQVIAFQSCTVTWPQDSSPSTPVNTPHKFILVNLTLEFPSGELSLVCGKLGSGKSLLLLALLGEADVVTGQMKCPRSPPDALASFSGTNISQKDWVVEGMCAYVPQVSWLRNVSIKQNILFHLPYDKERYEKTLEAGACALVKDLEILEDGDESEIGELGVTLSGGQKARVSLARAVYSRASILLLDDVLSAVDAHTAHHLYHACLKGDLVKGRTVILVSHHVQLCAEGASYIVALDNGRLQFQGNREHFQASEVIKTLRQSTLADAGDGKEEAAVESLPLGHIEPSAAGSSANSVQDGGSSTKATEKTIPRKLVEQEVRAVGRVAQKVWETYIRACGDYGYWTVFTTVFGIAALSAVAENVWLSYWSGGNGEKGPIYYVMIYTLVGLIVTTGRWLVLYSGSMHASSVLYQKLLQAVLFADFRFHDTSSRGRLLNRFGKDFEGIDSVLSENIGYVTVYVLATVTSITLLNLAGGIPFTLATILIGIVFYKITSIFIQTSRDTQSPLYSSYSESIAGVTVLRAFGASSKILRDMLRTIDTNSTAFYWTWGLNRWLSIRFDFLAGTVMCAIAVIAILNKNVSAATAGLALAFSNTVASNLLFLVRRWVEMEQSMVALERVNEYCEIDQEPPEFIEPRPPASWPAAGAIECQDLVVRYAPELPAVLHNLTFTINPGEKVDPVHLSNAIPSVNSTGSGKSTLALSFLRFVSPSEGKIIIDGLDISRVGLADLRSKLTIIPQDPTILSGSIRSTLDVFGEYSDAEIFEALRRVHLIPAGDAEVSEGGDNFSAWQLLCMARAILKKSKILVMDEATASVDYATDELIGKTISQEFAESTILTVAHRIRSVVTYDKIMLLDQGRIAEFDTPRTLLANPSSQFHALCKASGPEEFAMLKKLAGL
ncbi:multidrug resistance-associated ABC transporter [Mycena galericulata]|nr:multidrug resistance-associated ABC transporter [Mycena galericulata]